VPLNLVGEPTVPREIRVIAESDNLASLPIVEQAGTAKALVWPGMGAHLRSMHRISLSIGGRTVALRHPMEAVYYVIAGAVTVTDLDTGSDQDVWPGGMVLIDPGTRYSMSSNADGCELVGGPCPADPKIYEGLGGD
jgi:mannose-6-phosphate isomerase-like protein (cupin superfamily)